MRLTTRYASVGIRDSRRLAQITLASAVFWLAHAPDIQAAELPLVIPQPQVIVRASNEDIVLGKDGCIAAEIVLGAKGGFFAEAGDLIEKELKQRGFTGKASSILAQVIVTTRDIMSEKTSTSELQTLSLTPAEQTALRKSEQAYVIRMKPGKEPVIWIVGASPLGAYYGTTSLLQLIEWHAPDRAVAGNIEVQDYPDIPFRMCADWVLVVDWDVNCYDWGDGLDAFLARSKRKIDMCSRYKVNMVRFLGGRITPGPEYMNERYPMIKRFALELNRYARQKGVALQYSTVSWGRDYGAVTPEPWVLNREHYPDGNVYSCWGGTTGSCLSNDELTCIVANRARQFVEDNEPGSIYLHHIDVAEYANLARHWTKRCPRCRMKYPDDDLSSPNGCAAAVANLYNAIVAELKAVKNPHSNYDAARDLQIVFAAPGYWSSAESDVDWENGLKYFQEIGRQLKDKENVRLTFREQYKRMDNRGLRTEEAARCLADVRWPDGLFMFAIQGGESRMFVSSSVLTEIYRGAKVIYNFNGHVHSEVQVLANVNYAWNQHAPGWVDPMPYEAAALQAEASQYAAGAKHSDYLYGPFLATACARLYGEKAAPYMCEMLGLEKDKGAIWPVLATTIESCWKDANYDWNAQAERNRQAKLLADQALAVCSPEAREDLSWLSRCLEVAARICEFQHAIHRKQLSVAHIDAKATELLAWLNGNFQFQKTEPDGGDPAIWRSIITRAQRHYATPHAK